MQINYIINICDTIIDRIYKLIIYLYKWLIMNIHYLVIVKYNLMTIILIILNPLFYEASWLSLVLSYE